LKMARMEAMLQQQISPTGIKANKTLISSAKTPDKPKPVEVAKNTPSASKKPSLADTFKDIPSPSPKPVPLPTVTPSKPKPTLSDTFSTALGSPATKSPGNLPKKSPARTPGAKPIKVDMDDAKIDKCPHSGIRITNRTIAKSDFNCAVATRRFIKINNLPIHFKDKQDVPGDWVTTGVIVRKAGPYKSSTGNDYSIWTLSDLVSLENKISLFMFKDSHTEHRKETVGTVVAILNPNYMPPRDQEKNKKTDLAFSLDMSQKLLRMGMSTDYSTCKNMTKGGQACNNFINKAITQYCDFHIIKVHAAMRNKRMVLNTSYTPQPNSGKFDKLRQDCQAFVHKGSVYYPNVKPATSQSVDGKDSTDVAAMKKKGMMISTPLLSSAEFKNRLKIQTAGSVQLKRSLEGEKEKAELESSSKRPKLGLLSSKTFLQKHVEKPTLSGGGTSGGFINLNTSGQKANAKAKAILLARKGGFAPTKAGGKRSQMTPDQRQKMKERSLGIEKPEKAVPEEILNGPSDMLYHKPIQARRKVDLNKENKAGQKNSKSGQSGSEAPQKRGILSAAFKTIDADSAEGKQIMKAQSMNAGTLKEKEIERTSEYFGALEKFEHNEEKLMNIKEMKITVYICDICNSATQKQQPKCIDAKHLVRKGPSIKKFFKCKSCSQRTDVVGLPYPDHACGKCGKVSWEKCSMYHEKKGPKLESERLVVRAEDAEVVDKFR